MTRRDDDIFDLITELPWWVGVIFAGVTYLVMRYLLPTWMDDGSMTASLAELPRMFAVPATALVLLASAVSAFRSLADRARSGDQRSATPGASRPCPQCGGELVMRRASRGAHAGSSFWGCSSFPKCRYTEDVPA